MRTRTVPVTRKRPDDLVLPLDRPPDLVWRPDEVREVWAEEGLAELPLDGTAELDPFPQGQQFSFDAQRPALTARGLSEAENELAGLLGRGLDVVVAFAHRGEAERQRHLLRRVEPAMLKPGDEPAGLSFAVAPVRRGFVWRDLGVALLPDTQVFRRRAPRATAPIGRALASFSDLRTGDYVVHEDHGIAQLLGFETKEVASVVRDYLLLGFRGEDRVFVPHEQIGKVSRYIGADSKGPTLSKLGGKAWDNLKNRAREHLRDMAGELLAAVRAAPGAARRRLRRRAGVGRAARGRVSRTARRRTRRGRSRPSRRTSRRLTRWIGSSAATSASARPRSRSGRRSPSRWPASRC